MNYTDIIIRIIDRCQIIYEWFVRLFGNVIDLFEKIKDFILELVEYIQEKFSSEVEIENFLKNYIENEHIFV